MSRNHPFTRLILLSSGASPCRTSRAGSRLGRGNNGKKTRMRKFVLALAVSAAFATPAMAEDFSGPYIGTGVTPRQRAGFGRPRRPGRFRSRRHARSQVMTSRSALGAAFLGVEAKARPQRRRRLETRRRRLGLRAAPAPRGGVKLNPSTALFARLGYARNRVSIEDVSRQGDGVACCGAGVQAALPRQKVSLRRGPPVQLRAGPDQQPGGPVAVLQLPDRSARQKTGGGSARSRPFLAPLCAGLPGSEGSDLVDVLDPGRAFRPEVSTSDAPVSRIRLGHGSRGQPAGEAHGIVCRKFASS